MALFGDGDVLPREVFDVSADHLGAVERGSFLSDPFFESAAAAFESVAAFESAAAILESAAYWQAKSCAVHS